MSFQSGTVSFRQFTVVGDAPKAPSQDVLAKLMEHRIEPAEEAIGLDDLAYGWSGGRHLYDDAFTFEGHVFGETILFALRVDVNKVPGDVVRAWTTVETDAVAATNPSGFISKLQKVEVKETVRKQVEDAQRSGKYRRSRLLPVMWDMARGRVYAHASGSMYERLAEIFQRTFKLDLIPVTAGSLALVACEAKGARRDYEDTRPTCFVMGPEGPDHHPEYPWVLKGSEPKNFLGNEFLLWLWHHADSRTGIIATQKAGDVTVYFDRKLKVECAYGQTGKDEIHGDGPTRSTEAREALRAGKLPRKAGLILDANKQQFSITLDPEQFVYGGAKLPDLEEAENPRVEMEERVGLLGDLVDAVEGLYATFIAERVGPGWERTRNTIGRWIDKGARELATA